MRIAAFLLALGFGCFASSAQTLLLDERFTDGNWTHNPAWTGFSQTELITIDSSITHTTPYSCRVSTVSQRAAIETPTRIADTTQMFQIVQSVYVSSMGDEAIPLFLRGRFSILALFLLPNGLVQLDVLKSTIEWQTEQLRVPSGYALNRWVTFRIVYDGAGTTTLYIDNVLRGSVYQRLVDIPAVLQIGNKYLAHTSTFNVDDIRIAVAGTLPTPGNVYVVLCSDTGVWDGLGVNTPTVYLRFDLYTSPTGNAARVINPQFRDRVRGSDGEPMKFTWFMLDGSVIATNTNPIVQHRWISNLEMMKRYHGSTIALVADELSLHYHNWVWNDPDSNSVFHWNQSTDLAEYRNDFLETIGHDIIEGNMMPATFRSGWHYMSSEWEALIDSIIPYRFENTSPYVGRDTTEPLDNNYDWSRASLQWTPYHPAANDYQINGDLKGWESRCVYMKSFTSDRATEVFNAAFHGADQVVTVWSHLPEADFPEQILTVDSLIRLAKESFPEVSYHYLTATQAMQRWRKIQDHESPQLSWTVRNDSTDRIVTLESNEPLWNGVPFICGKKPSGRVSMISSTALSSQLWSVRVSASEFSVLGIGATDTAGNTVARTIDLSSTSVSTEGKKPNFTLFDNYPNPCLSGRQAFNPTTKIRYQISEVSRVALRIFDVLGREVTTLVNEVRDPGEYSVSFNVSTLASGVYFYRLQSGNLAQTKKMLLIQ
ncbi:MAG: T9SS type A sorting domain-containing protein [Ignavibacteriae bacterium]|nr:T9SS type A sorting domain-containing protein [Ignavibacteriota bacterium]